MSDSIINDYNIVGLRDEKHIGTRTFTLKKEGFFDAYIYMTNCRNKNKRTNSYCRHTTYQNIIIIETAWHCKKITNYIIQYL